MNIKKMGCIAIILALCCQNVIAENNEVSYKNLRGSILKLKMHSDNSLSGSFTTAVASKECQKAIGMKRPIIGYIIKNALTFSVDYPGCGVVTFIGNMENNEETIDTTALVAHSSDQISKEGPGAWMLSHDVFKRI